MAYDASGVPEEFLNLPKGTHIYVTVDGIPRGDVTVIAAEGVFEDIRNIDFKKPLVPGYWCSTAGGFASIRAKNIIRIIE